MLTFGEVPVDALIWSKPERMKQHFELRRDQAVVATLIFDPSPGFQWGYTARLPATAETDGGRWRLTVVRRGFLGMKGDVRVEGTNAGALEASYLLRRGTLTMSGVQDYQWFGGIWENSFDVFKDLQGTTVLRLDPGNYFARVNARVSVSPGTTSPRDAVLLSCVGLYMRLLMDKVYD